MKETDELLSSVSHRPWKLPTGRWSYYQEWNNVLFLHWKVPTAELTKHIPSSVSVDTFNGEAWISLVAFTMERIRPRNLPSVSMISDFHEINIRTYVTQGDKSGVYFLSIEAEKQLSCFIAKSLSGLPYTKTNIHVKKNGNAHSYSSTNMRKGFHLEANFLVGDSIAETSALDHWLTERYALYLEIGKNVFRYDTHHRPWALNDVNILDLKTDYKIGSIFLERRPDLVHYSFGTKVLAWKRTML